MFNTIPDPGIFPAVKPAHGPLQDTPNKNSGKKSIPRVIDPDGPEKI